MKKLSRLPLILILIAISVNMSVKGQGVVTIPLVVHVLWNDSAQNIPDANIYDQIRIFNLDFRKLNPDTNLIPVPFRPFAGDAKIEFCLAQRDTNGNATTGITRTYTSTTSYNYPLNLDSISHTTLGGDNSWNSQKYLNIWIGNWDSGLGTSPYKLSLSPDQDGIYIPYDLVGSIGVLNYYDAGRTADRLIGEWLNLLHIWGDTICGNDSVADTPPAEGPNFNCPSIPHNPNSYCGTDANGEMTVNYMDYTNGICKHMFTNGQIARMHDCLNTYRSGLLTSDGCMPVGINELSSNNKMNVKLFPNPTTGMFYLSIDNVKKTKMEVYNAVGQVIYQSSLTSTKSTIDLSGEPPGVYIVRITDAYKGVINNKIVKQ